MNRRYPRTKRIGVEKDVVDAYRKAHVSDILKQLNDIGTVQVSENDEIIYTDEEEDVMG